MHEIDKKLKKLIKNENREPSKGRKSIIKPVNNSNLILPFDLINIRLFFQIIILF